MIFNPIRAAALCLAPLLRAGCTPSLIHTPSLLLPAGPLVKEQGHLVLGTETRPEEYDRGRGIEISKAVEVAGVVRIDRSDHVTHAIAAPSIALSWRFRPSLPGDRIAPPTSPSTAATSSSWKRSRQP